MTHPGDNPFLGNGNTTLTDDDLMWLETAESELTKETQQIQEGLELLASLIPIVDAHGITRLFDTDTEIQDELQEARFSQLKQEVEREILATPEGRAKYGTSDFTATVEYEASMMLIAERRLQQSITTMAMKLVILSADAPDDKRADVISDLEEEKRIYMMLLIDHYKMDPQGWPAAFDEMTPGVGFPQGVAVDPYRAEAKEHADLIKIKEHNEQIERDELADLLGVNKLDDKGEQSDIKITLAAIQECADNIEAMNEPNAYAQRGEMIWLIGEQAGLAPEVREKIARYYDAKHPLAT